MSENILEENDAEEFIDDDELILKSSEGEVLEADNNYALIKQFEHVVSYRLEGFFKENGKPRSARALKTDPPTLILEDSDGNMAEFMVSQELASNFSKLFDSVEKAYYGIDITEVKKKPLTQQTIKDSFSKVLEWAKIHPVKAGLLVVILIVLVIGFFL